MLRPLLRLEAPLHFAIRTPLAAAALLTISALAGQAQRATLTQHVPQIVQQGHATRLGSLEVRTPVQAVISLPLRNRDALNALIADLYDPASPSYHKWLQPADFDARFGPTAADYDALISWARSNNLQVVGTATNKRVLTVQANAALMNRALHIQLTSYHDDVHNRDFRAPDREPTLDLDIPVLAVSGLDTANPRKNHHMQQPPETLSRYISVRDLAIQPRATGSGPSGTFLPSDMRAAYYGGSLTGTGQSVAIFSYDGYLSNDVPLWYTDVGLAPSSVPITNVLTGGFDGGCELNNPCDDGEQVLDILQVQGMAPGLSHIYFYEGLSAVTQLNQMASDNLASVITSSWGGGDFGPACDPALLQMMAQGQTFLNATGDDGAYNGWTYLPPSSDPYITQVGGTDLTTASAGGAWSAETAWADSGGGFFDSAITIPSWQTTPSLASNAIITATNAGSTTLRNSPDIAAEANFDNSQVSNGSFSTGWGGTSYATPRLAGYIALANQQSVAAGTGRLGFINPTLYQLGVASQATYFHDITSGKNTASTSYNGTRLAFNAVAGYDLVTGWGSPNGPALLNALTGPNFSMSMDASSVTVVRSSTATVHLTINPINNFSGVPTFSITNLPAGISASLSVASTNHYTLTLTGDGTVTPSTSAATIIATYGAFVQTGTVSVSGAKRAGYDFTISATNATVTQMSWVNSVVTVNRGTGYDGPIDLTATNLPVGVTVQFGTPSTFSSSNFTFFASIGTAPGTYTVLLTGTAGGAMTHTIPVTLTILAAPSAVADGGFEGSNGPWTFTSSLNGGYQCSAGCGYFPHGNSNFAYLNGWGATDTDTLSQTITVPVVNTATLNFWLMIGTAETTTTAKNDNLTVSIVNTAGTSTTIATFSNLDRSANYVLHSYDLSAYRGQTLTLKFAGVENSSRATSFLLDDISVTGQ